VKVNPPHRDSGGRSATAGRPLVVRPRRPDHAGTGAEDDRPARGGPIVCFWEEVHLRGTFAPRLSIRFLKRP
jgi:hypothetical protein